MRSKEIAIVVIVSYNFKTKKTMSKEFSELEYGKNPIQNADDYKYNTLDYTHTVQDGWQHKMFTNKRAEMLRKKAWGNLES